MWLLSKYRRLRRKQQYRQYNRIHQTNIRSDDASLKACYGNGVSIADTVIVSSDVSIGKYSYVNPHSTLENCTVGNYCSISAGVNICPGEHDLYAISTHPLFARDEIPKRAPVVIGHDVLISLNAVILKGVHIGNGAVILQTSVDGTKWVTADVETDFVHSSGTVSFDASNGINDIQLMNGCYYRIIVAYKKEIKIGTDFISFWEIKATPHRDCGADAQSDFSADCA